MWLARACALGGGIEPPVVDGPATCCSWVSRPKLFVWLCIDEEGSLVLHDGDGACALGEGLGTDGDCGEWNLDPQPLAVTATR